MRNLKFVGLAATLLLGVCATTETAVAASRENVAAFMPIGMTVDAPRGYTDMCRIRTQLCQDEDPRGAAQLASFTSPAATVVASASAQTVAPYGKDSTASISSNLFLEAAFVRPAFLKRAFVEPALLLRSTVTESIAAPAVPVAAEETPPPPPTMGEAERMKLLKDVNRAVNSRVRAQTDMQRYGVEELWNRTGMERGAAGDCEDFAIEKREQLISAGYPAKDLFFAVAFRVDLGLHAVLVARTDEGDLVLDNRSAYVTPWAKAPYIWVKRQSQEDPMRWGLVDDSAPPPRPRELQVAALSPELALSAASAGQ